MPRNGSGTFTRDNGTNTGGTVWAQDRDAGTNIISFNHDLHDQDIADALTGSLAKDGQTTPTANIPMGGFKHTNVALATARTDYARTSQVQDGAFVYGGTSGGAANAFTLAMAPSLTSYGTGGLRIYFFANHSINGASTLNIDSIGALPIRNNDGTTATGINDIINGQLVEVVYSTAGGGRFHLSTVQGMGSTATPTFNGINLTSNYMQSGGSFLLDGGVTSARFNFLTANRPLWLNGSKDLESSFPLSTFTPTVDATGAMTVTGSSVTDAYFINLGGIVLFKITVVGTLGGIASNIIEIDLPVAGSNDGGATNFIFSARDGDGTRLSGVWRCDGANLELTKPGGANWTLGANFEASLQGFYRI